MDATRNARPRNPILAAERAVRERFRRKRKASRGHKAEAALRLKDSVTAALKVEGDMWLRGLRPTAPTGRLHQGSASP